MRSRFDSQLNKLNKEMIQIGSLCEEAIGLSVKALVENNTDIANQVAPISYEIDSMEHEIETKCLKLLLQQQPVAGDLRQISAALKMITDIERIGDQAEDIAEIIKHLGKIQNAEKLKIRDMANETIEMVTNSVDSFVKRDIDLARKVISQDDTVDELFNIIRKALIEMISKNKESAETALDLLMIAKYFERIGDHATNIAEWVIFSITGIHKNEN